MAASRAAFAAVDTDGSGTLDADEVCAALGILGLDGLAPGDVQEVFDEMKGLSDGPSVSLEGFQQWWRGSMGDDEEEDEEETGAAEEGEPPAADELRAKQARGEELAELVMAGRGTDADNIELERLMEEIESLETTVAALETLEEPEPERKQEEDEAAEEVTRYKALAEGKIRAGAKKDTADVGKLVRSHH